MFFSIKGVLCFAWLIFKDFFSEFVGEDDGDIAPEISYDTPHKYCESVVGNEIWKQ